MKRSRLKKSDKVAMRNRLEVGRYVFLRGLKTPYRVTYYDNNTIGVLKDGRTVYFPISRLTNIW